MEQRGPVLPGPATARPRLGRGLPRAGTDSARVARRALARSVGRRGVAAAGRHARRAATTRRPARRCSVAWRLAVAAIAVGQLRGGNGPPAAARGHLPAAVGRRRKHLQGRHRSRFVARLGPVAGRRCSASSRRPVRSAGGSGPCCSCCWTGRRGAGRLGIAAARAAALAAAGRTRRTAAAGRRIEVEFYRRFETLLARHGLVRAAGQTQREFAAAAGLRVAAIAREPGWPRWPARWPTPSTASASAASPWTTPRPKR